MMMTLYEIMNHCSERIRPVLLYERASLCLYEEEQTISLFFLASNSEVNEYVRAFVRSGDFRRERDTQRKATK